MVILRQILREVFSPEVFSLVYDYRIRCSDKTFAFWRGFQWHRVVNVGSVRVLYATINQEVVK